MFTFGHLFYTVRPPSQLVIFATTEKRLAAIMTTQPSPSLVHLPLEATDGGLKGMRTAPGGFILWASR